MEIHNLKGEIPTDSSSYYSKRYSNEAITFIASSINRRYDTAWLGPSAEYHLIVETIICIAEAIIAL